ncbi:hypothetical protein K474DRAFT_1039290 [Panus rudis PR-1116 ss-1]|nr:hypothetical protein K474DRAFT_1039290 [Panus rudis PR-1116 ss-1]
MATTQGWGQRAGHDQSACLLSLLRIHRVRWPRLFGNPLPLPATISESRPYEEYRDLLYGTVHTSLHHDRVLPRNHGFPLLTCLAIDPNGTQRKGNFLLSPPSKLSFNPPYNGWRNSTRRISTRFLRLLPGAICTNPYNVLQWTRTMAMEPIDRGGTPMLSQSPKRTHLIIRDKHMHSCTRFPYLSIDDVVRSIRGNIFLPRSI